MYTMNIHRFTQCWPGILDSVLYFCYVKQKGVLLHLYANEVYLCVIGKIVKTCMIPIPPALLAEKDRDFSPDENNAEIAKISAQESLDALQGTNSPTSDALLFSASLTLWDLEHFNSVNEASVAVHKIMSSRKAAERFNRAA